MPKILIVDAAGNLKKHLVKILTFYGEQFYVSLKTNDGSNPEMERDFHRLENKTLVKFVDIDSRNLDTITCGKLRSVEKIFLAAPILDSLEMTRKIVKESIKAQSVKQIVQLSQMGVNLRPPTSWGLLNEKAENLVKDSGLFYTIIRPNYFMQNFLKLSFITSVEGSRFCLPLKNAKVSFVDTRDVAEVAAKILRDESNKHYNQVYDVTGGQRLSCVDVSDLLAKVLDKPIKYYSISDYETKEYLLNSGIDLNQVNTLLDFYRVMREGRLRKISKVVKNILGRRPISFEAFAADYISHFKSVTKYEVSNSITHGC